MLLIHAKKMVDSSQDDDAPSVCRLLQWARPWNARAARATNPCSCHLNLLEHEKKVTEQILAPTTQRASILVAVAHGCVALGPHARFANGALAAPIKRQNAGEFGSLGEIN